MKITSKSLTDTEAAAAYFLKSLTPQKTATIVALHGDLGAGKTAFSKITARLLGIPLEVTSPTFVIEKVYEITKPEARPFVRFIHIDAYRLKGTDELKHLGWEELIIDSGNLIIIEWPEHVVEAIPENAHRIRITIPSTQLGTSGEGESRIIEYGS